MYDSHNMYAVKRPAISGLLVGACLLFVSAAHGQSGTGLAGRVVDHRGGGIPGASVTLFSDDRVRTTKTNYLGDFTFADLTGPAPYIEVVSKGYYSASVAVTNIAPQPLTVTLTVGSGSQCPAPDDEDFPSAYYEERSSNVQLTGTVVEFSGPPLANASLRLERADLTAPSGRWPDPTRVPAMRERDFKYVFVAQATSTEKGEFQFADLEPGWYSLTAAHGDYYIGILRFWIARQNLTRTARIHLVPKAEVGGCFSIFGLPAYPAAVPLTLAPGSPVLQPNSR
jgi:hypothetical protein